MVSVVVILGAYNPDWAFVTEREEKLYFVRETKSTLDSEELRSKEKQKIDCGRKHFDTLGEFDRLHKGLDQALKDLIERRGSSGSLKSLKERSLKSSQNCQRDLNERCRPADDRLRVCGLRNSPGSLAMFASIRLVPSPTHQ